MLGRGIYQLLNIGWLLVGLCSSQAPASGPCSYKTTKSPSHTTTFSIVTNPAAASTASAPTVDDGAKYIEYSTVGGFFLQDLQSTDPTTFDYTKTNFGLINQTYKSDSAETAKLTQWERFNRLITAMNDEAPRNVVFKLFFIGRHGEGYHNAAETYYGTPAWNCYYSELNGNSTVTWADAHLTPNGISQAVIANKFWAHELKVQKIQPPQSFYVSPLTRCLSTAHYTYSNLSLPRDYPFIPTVKELFREGISIHTCDRRSSLKYIRKNFPTYKLDPTLTEHDQIWNGISAETSSAQDYRSKFVLDQVFSSDLNNIISVTTHSGETASLLRVLGHIPFSLTTGEIIPVLVKAKTRRGNPQPTSTMPWTKSSWCFSAPPKTSMTAAPSKCVCRHGETPIATTASMSRAM